MSQKVIISIVSPPGGGKTTILKHLSELYKLPILSSGDIARKMQEDIDAKFILEGKFAPEEEMRRRLDDSLKQLFEKNNVVLADGFPRFIDQYEWLKETLPDVHLVMYHLDVPLDTCMQRLKDRSRSDDLTETIKLRFDQYTATTEPLVKHFKIRRFNYDFATQVIKNALKTD